MEQQFFDLLYLISHLHLNKLIETLNSGRLYVSHHFSALDIDSPFLAVIWVKERLSFPLQVYMMIFPLLPLISLIVMLGGKLALFHILVLNIVLPLFMIKSFTCEKK